MEADAQDDELRRLQLSVESVVVIKCEEKLCKDTRNKLAKIIRQKMRGIDRNKEMGRGAFRQKDFSHHEVAIENGGVRNNLQDGGLRIPPTTRRD